MELPLPQNIIITNVMDRIDAVDLSILDLDAVFVMATSPPLMRALLLLLPPIFIILILKLKVWSCVEAGVHYM